MLRLIEDLAQDWRGLDAHGGDRGVARQGRRLMSAPGIGPIISSYGSGSQQRRSVHQGVRLRRLGLVSKQISTGTHHTDWSSGRERSEWGTNSR
jgi:hypothetical protein